MSATTFACPHCRTVLKTAGNLQAGTKFKCPKCAAVLTMGGAKAPAGAAAVRKPNSADAFNFHDAPASPAVARGRQKQSMSAVGKLVLALVCFGLLIVLGGGLVGAAFLLRKTSPESAMVAASST